jgi:hypothetical protein
MTSENIKKLYAKLDAKKHQFVERGRECSELTLSSLLPPEGFGSSSELYTPYQSVGARGVNNLASKLLLLLLPPNEPFFRLTTSNKIKQELEDNEELLTDVEKSLAKIEREVMRFIEESALRVSLFEALKHLIVTGNVLISLPKNNKMKIYNITQYCIQRDADGNLIRIIIKEGVSPTSLDPETREMCQLTGDKDTDVDLYTSIEKELDGKFHVYQCCNEIVIPSSVGKYKEDDLPFMALRMVRVDTEDYGRSYVEEFLGDLKSLEGLSKSLLETSAASAKVVFMVKPNAVTKKRDLVESSNGDIITGHRDDVTTLQAEKQYDLQVVERVINTLTERLAFAFLLQSGVIRDAERVTAEEIRKLANELESSLGGLYSLLSQEFQVPLVNLLMKRLGSSGSIPKLPKGSVSPVIITGVAALGRGNDLAKLRAFIEDIGMLAQINPSAAQLIDVNDLVMRIATSHGIDTEGLIIDKETMAAQQQQEQQQQQQQQMAQQVTQGATPAVASGMMEGIKDGSIDPQALAQGMQGMTGEQ